MWQYWRFIFSSPKWIWKDHWWIHFFEMVWRKYIQKWLSLYIVFATTRKSIYLSTSFLIFFDKKIKMTIFTNGKAIFCSQSLGPTFGEDSNFIKFFSIYNLQIGDKCHTNASSYYDYPKSYQFFERSTNPINIFGT